MADARKIANEANVRKTATSTERIEMLDRMFAEQFRVPQMKKCDETCLRTPDEGKKKQVIKNTTESGNNFGCTCDGIREQVLRYRCYR